MCRENKISGPFFSRNSVKVGDRVFTVKRDLCGTDDIKLSDKCKF